MNRIIQTAYSGRIIRSSYTCLIWSSYGIILCPYHMTSFNNLVHKMQFLQHSLCVCGGAHNLQYIRAHLEKCIIWTHSEEVKYRNHLGKYGFIQHMSHTDAYSWRVSYDRIQDSCSKWVRMKCIWCCMRTLTSYSEWCCMMSVYDTFLERCC